MSVHVVDTIRDSASCYEALLCRMHAGGGCVGGWGSPWASLLREVNPHRSSLDNNRCMLFFPLAFQFSSSLRSRRI